MSTPPRIAAIPTTYKGIKFRSKLEAAWAEWFDSQQMLWAYEVQGYQLPSGQWYLPDFWLPECRTFVEVKGLLDSSVDLTRELARCVSYGSIGFDYGEGHQGGEPGIMVVLAEAPAGARFSLVYWDGTVDNGRSSHFNTCKKCGKSWFLWGWSRWGDCRNCGTFTERKDGGGWKLTGLTDYRLEHTPQPDPKGTTVENLISIINGINYDIELLKVNNITTPNIHSITNDLIQWIPGNRPKINVVRPYMMDDSLFSKVDRIDGDLSVIRKTIDDVKTKQPLQVAYLSDYPDLWFDPLDPNRKS